MKIFFHKPSINFPTIIVTYSKNRCNFELQYFKNLFVIKNSSRFSQVLQNACSCCLKSSLIISCVFVKAFSVIYKWLLASDNACT